MNNHTGILGLIYTHREGGQVRLQNIGQGNRIYV